MKTVLRLVLVTGFLVALTSCGGGSSNNTPATTPMDFILAFPTNIDLSQTPNLSLLISGKAGVEGSVNAPGLSFSTTFTTDTSGSATVSVPASAMLNAWDTIQSKGIFVHANDKVNVVAVNDLPYSMGTYAILPDTALGTTHYVASAGSGGASAGSYLMIVGTVNSTTVSIKPSSLASGHAAGTTYTITLDRGSAYQLAADAAAGDLTGTLVESSNPVAVFGGHIVGQIPSTSSYAGFLGSQTPATTKLGTEFVTVPLATRSRYRIRLVGIQSGTSITWSSTIAEAPSTINNGDVVEFVATGAVRAVTDGKPVLLMQLAEGYSADSVAGADPCMAVIPPASQYASSHVVVTPATSANVASQYANLVVPSSAVSSIKLNGSAVASGSFSAIGTTGYSAASIDIPAGTNQFTGNGTPFGLLVYGWGQASSENGFCFSPYY